MYELVALIGLLTAVSADLQQQESQLIRVRHEDTEMGPTQINPADRGGGLIDADIMTNEDTDRMNQLWLNGICVFVSLFVLAFLSIWFGFLD